MKKLFSLLFISMLFFSTMSYSSNSPPTGNTEADLNLNEVILSVELQNLNSLFKAEIVDLQELTKGVIRPNKWPNYSLNLISQNFAEKNNAGILQKNEGAIMLSKYLNHTTDINNLADDNSSKNGENELYFKETEVVMEYYINANDLNTAEGDSLQDNILLYTDDFQAKELGNTNAELTGHDFGNLIDVKYLTEEVLTDYLSLNSHNFFTAVTKTNKKNDFMNSNLLTNNSFSGSPNNSILSNS